MGCGGSNCMGICGCNDFRRTGCGDVVIVVVGMVLVIGEGVGVGS